MHVLKKRAIFTQRNALLLNDLATIQELQTRLALYEDMKAYKKLYELLYNNLFSFTYSFVKSNEVAEEIVSDVFIKLWMMRADVATIQNLKVYLFTVTKNFCLNYITKRDKFRVIRLEDLNDHSFFNYTTPESQVVSKEILAKIGATINSLPSQCRVIFYLVKEAGLKYKEVASVLNISANTVRNQIVIATHKIAESLPASIQQQLGAIRKFSES